jgi:hypothetical protein
MPFQYVDFSKHGAGCQGILVFVGGPMKVMGVLIMAAAATLTTTPTVDELLGARSPKLERLFTPFAVPPGMYEVYESVKPIERIAATLRSLDPAPARGAWDLQQTGPGDAFGAEASYNRVRLALLVGGGRITVARGSLRSSDGKVTAYTLLSPYPDPELTELRLGTMTIVFHLPTVRQ